MRLTAFLVMPLLAGCAPRNVAKSACHREVLATGDPWACTVAGKSIDQASSISFDTESRNQVAQVKISLRVTKGILRLGYRDLSGDRQLSITPDAPAALEMQTRLHRDRRSFTLSFELGRRNGGRLERYGQLLDAVKGVGGVHVHLAGFLFRDAFGPATRANLGRYGHDR